MDNFCDHIWLLDRVKCYHQSWTKVLTHLSKTNAFYRRPSVISKSIFFVDSQHLLSPNSMSVVIRSLDTFTWLQH